MTERRKIFLALPHYAETIHGPAARAAYSVSSQLHDVRVCDFGCSLLGRTFNMLWAEGLKQHDIGEADYFAMLHSDISPEEWWLDKLVDEIERLDADLVSVVSPIKNGSGLTSTAVGHPEQRWSDLRQLSIKECHQLPETFCSADLPKLGGEFAGCKNFPLLVNTGCWIANLNRPFWTDTNKDGSLKLRFTINDRIMTRRNPETGRLETSVDVESEDWGLSRDLHSIGARVYATTAVSLRHFGVIPFTNEYQAVHENAGSTSDRSEN